MSTKVAVIGGGVAGVSITLRLANEGCKVVLYEKERDLISGPPFCHLHAGGNLYREIDDAQCRTLLRQSIDFARRYPFCVDRRPTLITVPLTDESDANALLPRLHMLRDTYAALVRDDSRDAVLGDPNEYFRCYDDKDVATLRNRPVPQAIPQDDDEWMIAALTLLDTTKLHQPLIMVREYGLNLFRLAAGTTLALEAHPNVTLRRQTEVTQIKRYDTKWEIAVADGSTSDRFDYLINAAGFRTGKIDEMIGLSCTRLVEFKAAYVAKWQSDHPAHYPEIIVHGKRGTPQGMGQFTPYPQGLVQLHAMRKDATLYEDGLVAAPQGKCQAPLPRRFVEKIERGWSQDEIDKRTGRAIEHLTPYVPSFQGAVTGAKPLFGAQQIPGDDPDLRVAEAAFPIPRYARCEIVKVSSVGDMCDAIVDAMCQEGLLDNPNNDFMLHDADETAIDSLARRIARSRGYPEALATMNIPLA